MRHAFIATPVHSGQVWCEYAKSLIDTLPHLAANGIAYTHSFCIGDALIHDARNRMAAWFMASEATDLLFIDADIQWEPQDAVRLVTSPHDVIGGAYRQKRDDAELYNVAGPRAGATRLIEVDYIATGFLKISRKAMQRLNEAHADTRYQDRDGHECFGVFDTRIADGRIVGEDALFCRRWRETGGKVFLDPDMTLTHHGNKGYEGNFADLMQRVSAARPEEAA